MQSDYATEVYKQVLDGDGTNGFPRDFWKGHDSMDYAAQITRYLFEDILNWNRDEICKNVNYKVFFEYRLKGMLSSLFNGSSFAAVENAYPGEFKPWEFMFTTKGFWNRERAIEAVKWLVEEKLGLSPEEAHSITKKQFKSNGLGGVLVTFFKGSHKRALEEAYNMKYMQGIENKNRGDSFKGQLYSDEELLEIIRSKARELGRGPSRREVSQYLIISKRFGSWNDALLKAGLFPNRNYNYSEKEISQILREKSSILRRTPHIRDFRSIKFITDKNMRFSEALRNSGITPFYKNDEELIEELKNLSQRLGKGPSITEAKINGLGIGGYIKHFGSWNNALKRAGLEINPGKPKIYGFTKEELLEDYIEVCNRLGRFATSMEVSEYCKCPINVYGHRFGDINEVRKLIEKDPRLTIEDMKRSNHPKLYSDSELRDVLAEIYNTHGRMSASKLKKYLRANHLPSLNTFLKRFKTTSIIKMWDDFIRGTS